MVSQTNEQALEAAIEKCLTGTCREDLVAVKDGDLKISHNHGYQLGYPQDFKAKYAVDEKFFWQFLQLYWACLFSQLATYQKLDICCMVTELPRFGI